ncbi:hypothetical protein GGR54DRAFT_225450 [Hypoxylon sp. NC1633]|nr:hypothetical protein GGR54DRAFT_225450 [Hypoxylon sp. NC1633]
MTSGSVRNLALLRLALTLLSCETRASYQVGYSSSCSNVFPRLMICIGSVRDRSLTGSDTGLPEAVLAGLRTETKPTLGGDQLSKIISFVL